MQNLPQYTKLFAVGTRNVKSIFDEEVEITEKIDGSMFRFGKINGELLIGSKSCLLDQEKPENLFTEAVAYVKSIQDELINNVVYYGECLKRPKHNTLVYDFIPRNHIALFGMYYQEQGSFEEDYDLMAECARQIDVDVVPIIYKGKVTNEEQLKSILERTSYLGGCHIEGVVIKNYSKQCVLTPDVIFPFMGAKFVSENFKEVHRSRCNSEEKPNSKWESFCEQYRTPARWDKAVIHLKEKGLLDESPKDIGAIMKEIQEDIASEEKENIKDFLWELHKKSLLSNAVKGVPQWYKDKVMKTSWEQ